MSSIQARVWVALVLGCTSLFAASSGGVFGQVRGPERLIPPSEGELPPPRMLPESPKDTGPDRWDGMGTGRWLQGDRGLDVARTRAEVNQDDLWVTTVARQNLHHDQNDPPFDAGDAPYHFFVAAGADLLKPHLESNPAYTIFRRPTAGTPGTAASAVQRLDYEVEFTPKVSIGVVLDSGWGLRSSWSHFAEGSERVNFTDFDRTASTIIQSAPAFGIPGFTSPGALAQRFGVFNNSFAFGSHLETHVWDGEITKAIDLNGWQLLVSGGGRYTYISQGYSAVRGNGGIGRSGTSRVVLTQDMDRVTTGHNMSGFGPTAAVEVHRPLWDTGFGLYGVGRSSVLFGRGRTHSQQFSTQNFQVIPVRGSTQTTRTTTVFDNAIGHDDDLPVEEIEIGVEWKHAVGRAIVGVQTGMVYQEWINAGSGSSEKGDLSFFGLSLTAGVTF